MTVGNGGNFPNFTVGYSIAPTEELVASARDKWMEIRDQLGPNDDSWEMDTIFTAILSRLTAYNEVAQHSKQQQSSF